MNSKKIYERLARLENGLDLSKFRVNDIDIWPHMRFQFIIGLNRDILNSDPRQQSYFSRVWAKLLLSPRAVLGIIRLYVAQYRRKRFGDHRKDVVFLTDSSAKRMKLDDRWYDSFIDPIIDHYEQANITYHTFESSQRFLFRYPGIRHSEPIIFEMILYYLRSLLFVRKIHFNQEFLDAYSHYRGILEEMGLGEHVIGLRELQFEVSYISQLVSYFHRELEKIKPRLVFMVPYNGYSGKALTYVCNKLSIISIDIQHGVQGDYHPAYSSFTNLPRKAFNTLPKVFLTWSETERNNINKWAAKTDSIRTMVLGNLYEEIFRSNNICSRHFDRLFGKTYHAYKSKLYVLISLIWDHYLPSEFRKLLLESPEQYFYLIRFHPSTTIHERRIVERELKKLGTNNYEIDNASHLPLYSVLRNVRFNITQRSSTVIEATKYGVISIITDKIGMAYYQEFITANKAYYCGPDEDIMTLLNNLAARYQHGMKTNQQLYQSSAQISVLSNLLEIAESEITFDNKAST